MNYRILIYPSSLLPGDVVRFRAFPCSNLLRVICQYSPDDKRPLLTPRLPQPTKQNEIEVEELQPLENQVPDSIIRANPREPLFARHGLTNPYLNYHAKILQKRRKQKQQQLKQQRLAGNFLGNNGLRIFF